jgi:hypothetical protein
MEIDILWTPGSWPWSVFREFVFTLAGQGKYTATELQALLNSEDLGPLGCGAIASILSSINAGMAEEFARKGLKQLSAEKLQKDFGVLLEPEAGLGHLLGASLRLLAQIRDQDLSSLTIAMGIYSSNALAMVVKQLRPDTNVSPAIALAPLVQDQWELWLKSYLGGALTNLLQKVATPANAEDALARALFIQGNAQNPEQAKEAIKFLTMAAEQGLPKAQMMLASSYVSGEAGEKELSRAMALYRKAAEAHEPHAGCRIADMYREGKGVPQDVGEATKWLQVEAEQNCGSAQFKLAMYAEQNKDTAKALDLFRRAATNCVPQAQAALGDRLSDGFTVPPNYPEAYLWFFAAAQAGDRFAGTSGRSLRPKLTPVQIQAAETESCNIIEKNNPGEQRRRMQQEMQRIQEQLRQSTGLPVADVRSMSDIVSRSTSREQFNTLLMTIFALAALTLAAIGIYGVMAYAVQQRTREIGVRLALGADPGRVRLMVVVQGMRLALVGVVIGIGAAYGLSRYLSTMLFGVEPRDPLVFAGVPLLLAVIALFAVWIPASRASRIDPLGALRSA